MARKNRRIVVANGQPMSRRILTARMIGVVSGIAVNLGELQRAAGEIEKRCERVAVEGGNLLSAEAMRMVGNIGEKAKALSETANKTWQVAIVADAAMRELPR